VEWRSAFLGINGFLKYQLFQTFKAKSLLMVKTFEKFLLTGLIYKETDGKEQYKKYISNLLMSAERLGSMP
jgi:hypothetical protein